MAAAFGKNSKDPFSTPVGHLIEKNTLGTNHSEDWGQFLNICDIINTTEDGPKDAARALKKRISKNYNQKELKFSLSSSHQATSVSSVNSSLELSPKGATVLLAPEQIAKLYSELDMVKMNVTVMSAILLENVPGSEKPEDMDLLQKLHKTCREMQERITELLVEVQNDDIIGELVQVNDDLNNAFLRYERFSRNRIRIAEESTWKEKPAQNHNTPSAPASDLIDLSYRPSVFRADVPSAGHERLTTGSETPAVNTLFSPNSEQMNASGPGTANPFLYPQLNLLTIGDTSSTLFTTDRHNGPSAPSDPQYDNIFSALPPRPLLPTVQPLHPTVLLQHEQANSASATTYKNVAKDSPSPPNYYEVIEFDPLANSNKTEVIYEDIDSFLTKPESKMQSQC
ncbi:TOM1-like protein 1 isoform X2 [Microcaecilia unicolor]|uniref:TOM1-like protein 1 isoform X2 n=1 Tax=Microcaecilia unicolor TaxID=1415580 RepID=A0A6P7YME5_9AMPH|nr:TOM1-like protein 1 isoform X2 [Microcaecilia unicolor]